jgi:hypothetical protein
MEGVQVGHMGPYESNFFGIFKWSQILSMSLYDQFKAQTQVVYVFDNSCILWSFLSENDW